VCGGLDEDCDGRTDEGQVCERPAPDVSLLDAGPLEDATLPLDARPDAEDPDARRADVGPTADVTVDATVVLQDTLAAVDGRSVDAATGLEDALIGPTDRVDAVPVAPPDTGPTPVRPAGRARAEGGCAVSPPNTPSPPANTVLALGLLAVLAARRQRACVSSTRARSARARRT
jgi:MYXO-CTERM domain-containing protein